MPLRLLPSRARHLLATPVCLLVLSACSDGGATAPPPDSASETIARRLGSAIVAVALAPQGAGPFDNSLPCGRRGVALYRDTEQGRAVRFHGCDLGGGVQVDGSGEILWPGRDSGDDDFCTFISREFVCPRSARWRGGLVVATPAGAGTVDALEIEDLDLSHGAPALPEILDRGDLGFGGMTVRLSGVTVAVEEPGALADVLVPPLAIDAIPNPSGSIGALSEDDLRRLAWDWSMRLAASFVGETIEPRGTHTHERDCGTLRVVRLPGEELPILEIDWRRCVDAAVVVDGEFVVRWITFDPTASHIALEMEGTFDLGGGVPTVALRRFEWTAELPSAFPGPVRISGMLEDASGTRRAFAFEAVLDD